MYNRIDNRVDLASTVEQLIEQEIEWNKQSLLEHDWCDSFTYYEHDIIAGLERIHSREFNAEEKEAILEWANFNQEDCITYVECSGYVERSNVMGFDQVGEIEIELPEWLKRRNKEIVNQYTDLYVNDSGYGYIYAGSDFVGLDLDAINIDEALEDIS